MCIDRRLLTANDSCIAPTAANICHSLLTHEPVYANLQIQMRTRALSETPQAMPDTSTLPGIVKHSRGINTIPSSSPSFNVHGRGHFTVTCRGVHASGGMRIQRHEQTWPANITAALAPVEPVQRRQHQARARGS